MSDEEDNNFLTEEDSELWEYITKEDKKLPGREIKKPKKNITSPVISTSPSVIPVPSSVIPAQAGIQKPQKENTGFPYNPSDSGNGKTHKYLEPGDTSGVDGKTAEKLRKGKMRIEATLDLHGYKQDEAIVTVQSFIEKSYNAGKRCVLIITGKGSFKEGAGVLRENLPRWLNSPSTRPQILMYIHARGEHGGKGAVYVYLRKNR